MANEKFLSWDSEIEQDSQEFVLLPEGDFPFVMQEYEKTVYSGNSDKVGNGCPMAILKIVIYSPKGNTSVQDRMYLSKDLEWKISSFFRSVGLKKHGEKYKMDWDAAIGKQGLCHIKQEKWIDKDGNEKISNKIDRYLDNMAAQAPTKPDGAGLPFEV